MPIENGPANGYNLKPVTATTKAEKSTTEKDILDEKVRFGVTKAALEVFNENIDHIYV